MSIQPIFQRPLALVSSADLAELDTTEEGWYVEFKELLPDGVKIAKSVCSFANSYGGLLVFGAKENQKTRRLDSLTGFSEDVATKAVTTIREAVSNHSSPSPYFETKVLEIPGTSETQEKRWVVLARIPQGVQPPYIHSSGAIFRRIGDSASPRIESNSSVIEQFVRDATRKRRQLAEKILRRCSEQTTKYPRCDIVVKLIDDGEIRKRRFVTFEQFHGIASTPHNDGSPPLYDNVFPHDSSFVARRVEGQLFNRSLLWDYDARGALHYAQIPLATAIWNETSFDLEATPFAASLHGFAAVLKPMVNRWAITIDFLPFLFFLADLLYRIKRLHALEEYKGKLVFNARLTNVNSCIPFLNTLGFKNQISNFGLPLALRNLDFLCDLENTTDWLEIKAPIHDDSEKKLPFRLDLTDGVALFARVVRSIGITPRASIGESESLDGGLNSLVDIFADLLSENFSFSSAENPSA